MTLGSVRSTLKIPSLLFNCESEQVTSVSFSFLIYQMGTIIPTSQGNCEVQFKCEYKYRLPGMVSGIGETINNSSSYS